MQTLTPTSRFVGLHSSSRRVGDRAILPNGLTRSASDSFDITKDFGTLKSSSQSTSNTASKQNPIFYKFKLDKDSKVRLTLENKRRFNPFTDLFNTPSVFATIFDSDKSSVQTLSKVDPGKSQKFTTKKLESGTYYLKVSVGGSKREVKYNLQVRRASSSFLGGLFG